VLFARILGLVAALAIGACVIAHLISGDRRYLGYAWRIFKVSLFLAVGVLLLIFAERLTHLS